MHRMHLHQRSDRQEVRVCVRLGTTARSNDNSSPPLEAFGLPEVDLSQFPRDTRSKGLTVGARFLVDTGMSADKHDKSDQTVLHVASKEGRTDIVKFILEQGATMGKIDKHGFVALGVAVLNGKFDIAGQLCKKMDIKTYRLSDGAPLLHWAIWKARLDVVKFLVNNKVVISTKDNIGNTPQYSISERSHVEVATLLVNSIGDVDAKDDRH